jgi:hypothetical protein
MREERDTGSNPVYNEFAYKSILDISQSGRRNLVDAYAKVSVVQSPSRPAFESASIWLYIESL